MNLIYLASLATMGQGLFLIFYILTIRQINKFKWMVAAIVLIEVFVLYDETFIFFPTSTLPWYFYYWGTPLLAGLGPLCWLLAKSFVYPKYRFKTYEMLHFVPLIFIICVALWSYHLLSHNDKMAYITYFKYNQGNPAPRSFLEELISYAFRLQLLGYTLAAFFIVVKRRNKAWPAIFSLPFIQFIFIGLILLSMLSVLFALLDNVKVMSSAFRFNAILLFLSSNIFGFTYAYFKYPIERIGDTIKYKKSGLSDKEADQIQRALEKAMQSDQAYRNPFLTLPRLAKAVGTNTHYLSQILNERFQMTFHEFVNNYRVKDAQQLLAQGDDSSMEDIRVQAGFASYSSFYRAFKKSVGVAPAKYRESLKP